MDDDLRHLKRWIKASILKALKLRLSGVANLFFEGEDRETQKFSESIEIRIDGPYSRPCGPNKEYCSYIEINLLTNCTRTEDNVFRRENLQGLCAYALNTDFCIFKTGNEGSESADNGSSVGVMQLITSDQIKTSDFGRINPDAEVYQSVSEAHYEMYHTL